MREPLCKGEIMSFKKIIRIVEHPARVDQSAPTGGRINSLMCIIAPLHELFRIALRNVDRWQRTGVFPRWYASGWRHAQVQYRRRSRGTSRDRSQLLAAHVD